MSTALSATAAELLADSALQARVADKAVAATVLLRRAAVEFAPAVFSTSLGVEDMVVADLIAGADLDIEIFTLDTWRLPAETYELLATAKRHYGRPILVLGPEPAAVEAYVARFGIDGFYDSIEARKACCQVRKVASLGRALAGKKAWVTGLRAEQAVSRSGLAPLCRDEGYDLMKVNPLADWSEREVWAYVHAHGVPYNKLHDQGYPSIGCAPCTRAVAPGEDVRAGRWWWENPEAKECGLHVVDGRLQRKKAP